MSSEITKKRKMEEGGVPDIAIEKIVDMISLWDNTQLVSVLSGLASQSTWALDAIRDENSKSVKLRKLFVRNLSFATTDDTLSNFFAQYGTVAEAVVIRNKTDNKSKGFGFVTFETVESADSAIGNGEKQLDGRTAYVSLAAKRGAAQNQNAGSNGMGNGFTNNGDRNASPLTKLFVRSLNYDTTQEQFNEFFSQYGNISEAVILTNKDNTSKGYGFVTYGDVESANRALEQPTKMLGGRDIHCKLAASNDGHQGRQQNNTQNNWQNQNNMYQQRMMNGMNGQMQQQQQALMSMMMGNMGGNQMGNNTNSNPYQSQQTQDQFQNLLQPQQQQLYQQQW